MTNTHDLPLFPLNTVLFPGMPLHLHIFEPRYKLMIGECIREKRPFGVILIRTGSEVGPAAETYDIGTTAHITHVKHLDDGEMNIATIGKSRFKIERYNHDKPYLMGRVQDFPLDSSEGDKCIAAMTTRLAPMVKRYLNIFATLGDVEFKLDKLPEDPLALGFLTAVILNVPIKDKQQLLSVPDLAALLKLELSMLTREALILKHLIEKGPRWRDEPGITSPN